MTQLGVVDVVDRLIEEVPDNPLAVGLVNELRRQIAAYPATPVVLFPIRVGGRWRNVWLKLEGESPWGSIKGRTAVGLLASIVSRFQPGCRLVESSSGNLGVALAALAATCGARLTVVVDERLPAALRSRLTAYSAEVVMADPDATASDLQRRLDTIERLIDAHPDWIWLNQYENPANPRAHEMWTAPELLDQLPEFQAVFVGVSTGGTLAGVAAHLRRVMPSIRVVGVDVEGSVVLGGPPGWRLLNGIGASRPSTHLLTTTLDAVAVIPSWAAIGCCRAFAEATGLRLGGSSGAALSACLTAMSADEDLIDAVCLCPDLGANYGDTIYNDQWIRNEKGAVGEPALVPRLLPAGEGLELAAWKAS
jgi:N-(2-amino-2-carboxyethyl)-L-glutamate synthase